MAARRVNDEAEPRALLAGADELEDLWRRNYKPLVRLATAITGSAEVAHDLTSEAFVRCHRQLGHVAYPDAYLRTAVVNATRSWGRRRTVELRHDRARSPVDALSSAPATEIWSVLAVLPWRQRVAIALRYHDDLDTAEIAATLGCAPATVRSLLHRGLSRLRKDLHDEQR